MGHSESRIIFSATLPIISRLMPVHDLGNHAARAEVHMADLGIAHLAGGQADIVARSVEQAMRMARHEAVPHRCAGLGDGVVLAL